MLYDLYKARTCLVLRWHILSLSGMPYRLSLAVQLWLTLHLFTSEWSQSSPAAAPGLDVPAILVSRPNTVLELGHDSVPGCIFCLNVVHGVFQLVQRWILVPDTTQSFNNLRWNKSHANIDPLDPTLTLTCDWPVFRARLSLPGIPYRLSLTVQLSLTWTFSRRNGVNLLQQQHLAWTYRPSSCLGQTLS